jgi:hypothetical protein
MMKALKKSTVVLLLALLIISGSCKKYEDGPFFSIYSKTERASGNWRFDQVKEDGVDITAEYANQAVNIAKSGDLYWTQGYIDSPWNTYGLSGKWNFVNSKTQIEMYFHEGVKDAFSIVWNIKRMAYADLQLERYDEGKKIEWKMWKY